MKMTFFGAAGEVTGSCTLIEHEGFKFLVDCGMFQTGQDVYARNAQPFPFDAEEIQAVILTHAHIDHIGRVPQLVRRGFSGRIFATMPTRLLAKFMWQDSASVLKGTAKKRNLEPLYERHDISAAYDLVHGVSYGTRVKIADGVHATFRDAGHIFGSSFVELEVGDKTIVFSGDIGNDNVPILRDTEAISHGDVIVLESTYGNRKHEDALFRVDRLKKAVVDAVNRKGTLLIPAFSLERAQEILYELNGLVENGELPRVPFYLDSPLAIRVLPIYKQFEELYDRDAKELKDAGDDFFKFDGLHITKSPEDSEAIKKTPNPKVIIAGSGMMSGGRIMRHLADYLDDSKTTVLVVGYQAAGTVGRALKEGAKRVKIDHEEVDVRAGIEIIDAYSAHADCDKLFGWAQSGGKPKLVILNHGDDEPREAMVKRFSEIGVETKMPHPGEEIEI